MNDAFCSKHFQLEQVGKGIYAAIAKEGGGAVGNAGLVDLGDKVIVFDTFNTQQASEDLRLLAEKLQNVLLHGLLTVIGTVTIIEATKHLKILLLFQAKLLTQK